MMTLIFVAVGGALGATLRHLVGMISFRLMGPGFPLGTLLVNVLGSFLMGLLIAWLAKRAGSSFFGVQPENLRLFLATGFLGGFTTFSAFSLDAVSLYERGAFGLAAVYVFGSVALCLAAVFAGLFVMRGATP